jgi:TatD DNase family protein
MRLFDTHAHLSDMSLNSQLDQVIQRAQNAGVEAIVAIGTQPQDSDQCVRIANQVEMVYAAVGYQPNGCLEATEDGWDVICELAKDPKVVAIGETGLDRYWDHCPFDIQQAWFHRHIELSRKIKKPLVIHMRECESDIIDSLNRFESPIAGIMHSYTGTVDSVQQCLDLGLHISFAGMVTFKKSDDLRQVAKKVPLDRLLIETDSPYLSPLPHRKQRPNEPALVQYTAECLAEVFGMPVEQLAEQTTENALKLFGLE